MRSPITITYPKEIWGLVTVTNQCPRNCRYKIPFATPLLTTCDTGSFLIQSVGGTDYRMELWSFVVKKHGFLELVIDQPFISIALFLKNSLSGELLGNGLVHSPARTYNIFYLPTGTQPMDLAKGNYVLFIIIPPSYYLENITLEHSGIKDILNRLSANKKEGSLLKNLPLPHGAWRIIKRLQKTSKKGVALDIELRRNILELLGLYHDQFKQSEINHSLQPTSAEKAIVVKNYILENLGKTELGGLNELSAKFYITTKSLTKEFKSLTGKTIPQFISDERLKWAKTLLDKKELRVFEIAFLVGFSEATNFIRKFKQKYGYPPRKEGKGRK